jgi:uncharacterized protein (DUF2235 family)
MAKNIVLLSDGTGNSAGKLFKTNVWRLFQALDLSQSGPDGKPLQIAYYHDGVGSSAFKPLALLGGAFGWGLKRNVIDLYTYLCRNYREGDRIYGFGFSRGAFTIRVLVGLVNDQGIVEADSEADLRMLATEAFRSYRRKYKTLIRLEVLARPVRDLANNVAANVVHPGRRKARPVTERPKPSITFLGLWDTVAAYGLPFDELTRAWNWFFPLSVPDREPCGNILRARHALALDDERNTFHPVLWNEYNQPQSNAGAKHIKDERISQVWFAGMHASVGGGYPDDALANVSLEWMMGEAKRYDLKFKPDALKDVAEASDIHGKLYDSRAGLGGGYRYLPRKLALLTNDTDDSSNQVVIKRPKIHESVFQRIAAGAEAYAPIVLPPSYAVVDAGGAIWDLSSAKGSTPGLIESRQEAEERANVQEKVWDLVWWRRVIYFSSVFVALLIVLFPLFWPAREACRSWLCGISWVVGAMGAVLPAAAGPWLEAYETRLPQFVLLAAIFAFLLFLGGWLRVRISDEMRRIWLRAGAPTPDLRGWLYRMRTSAIYQWLWKRTKWVVLPTIAGMVSGFFVVAGASKSAFDLLSSAGHICAATPRDQLVPDRLETGKTFTPDSVCWASGVELTEDVTYRVTITIDDPDEWKDSTIKTGIGGFGRGEMTPLMYLGLPFRRHLGEPWFKPIARIGRRGGDEYPLDPADILNKTRAATTLVSHIKARRSGELFLFVNDAVWPVLPGWQPYYRNNHGSATVEVRPARTLKDPPRPAAEPGQ